jgi:GT2 family glycosyltransferase/glycosyltransferase involved in cell wall biosynthesis
VAVFSNSSPDDALYAWRIGGPLANAGVEILLGATGGDLHLEAVEQADAILVQRDYPGRLTDYRRVVDRARSRSIPVLFEVDDLLFELPADHPDRQSHHYAPTLLPAFGALSEADLVITTTDFLRLRLARFNPHAVVFRNRLDEALWAGPPARPAVHGRSLGIGYFGTTTHAPDIEIVAAPLRALLDRYGERVAIRFYGCPPPPSLRDDPRVAWIPLAGGPYRDYVALLREAPVDIGIAPLADTDFNRAKSEAKFLEYSAAGIPGIYSDVGPYRAVVRPGRTGWLARSQTDWVEHLTRMIEDGALRERMGELAYREAHSRWNLSACPENWRATVERGLRARRPAGAGQTERSGLIRRLTEQNAAWAESLEAEVRAQRSAAEALTEELETRRAEITRGEQALTGARARLAERDEEIGSLGIALRRARAPKRLAQQLFRVVFHPIRTYRLVRDARVVRKSGEFDAAFYLSQYGDVRVSACEPGQHYCEYGWRERRNPSPAFDTEFYLDTYQDVADAGVNPLVHYITYGRREGRVARRDGPGPSRDNDRERSAVLGKGAAPATLPVPWLSRAAIGLCTLPATFFFYDSLVSWGRAIGDGASFIRDVLNSPSQIRTRLAGTPLPVRIFVSVPLSVALRIRKNGGLRRSIRNMNLVLRQEGLYGLRVRLTQSVPLGLASARSTETGAPDDPDRSRILVMDWRIPMADVSAGEQATVGILRDLCAIGYDVVFLAHDMAQAPGYEAILRGFGVKVVTSQQDYRSPADYVRKHGYSFGVFYLIRVDVAEAVLDLIRQVAPRAAVFFHAPDLYSLREGREADLKKDSGLRARADLTRERELAIIRQVDRTVLVSPAELPVLRQFVPDAPISVFPVLYAHVAANPAPFEDRNGILFLGGFAHPPNLDAVRWFVAEIWPRVRAQLPHATFHIVGSEAPQEILELASVPGINVRGFVKDLDPLLASMRIGVTPMRYGAGIKGKVAMMMGAGMACVCTSVAAEGMHVEDGVHACVTDDPGAFANAVVQLYTDRERWATLSHNGRELVRRRFGTEANRASLLHVLNDAEALPLPLWIAHCRALPPRPVPLPADGEAVDVSVIIPVYNQWDSTRACLNSVLESSAADDIRFEVILADDGSTDGTLRAAERYPGLRVVRTPSNVGFLRNCNQAARQARGRHILLLNNDTVVMPGWMSALHQLMEADHSAAMVGSKLLYPDGTIQEAGAVLWNDATAHNFGRGMARTAANCNYVREVDYVSGASVLIRKAFWESVGGFDERYETAYCEDSDLAMAARAAGHRVLYEPESEVIHFEHQTYAEQAPTHNPALQRRNIAKLAEKWAEAFATQHQPPTSPYHLGMANAQRSPSPSALVRRERGRLSVLYFSPFPSHPGNHGNQTTIRHFGRLFQSMGHRVHFVLLETDLFTKGDVEDMRSYWDTLDLIPNSLPMLADGNPIPFDSWYVDGLGEQIACLCAKYEIDVAFCSYVFQSRLLEFVPAHVLKVIDTHDKMGNRYEMLRANGQPLEFFSCTPEEEGAYLRRADVVVARREEEARYFDRVTGQATAIVIPHLEDPRFGHRTFSGPHHVGVVASANRINLAIVKEFLTAVERRLQSETCPFTVHVAGKVKDMVASLPSREADVFRRSWVKMHGFLPDIARFYAEMDLMVSPATMGTGINVKTVQAMAYGMPLLTTLAGCKGIETGDPMHSHPDLDALAASLLSLTGRPEELQRLAALSRLRYKTFYESGLAAMRGMFAHPKLRIRSMPQSSWGPGSRPVETPTNLKGPSQAAIPRQDAEPL